MLNDYELSMNAWGADENVVAMEWSDPEDETGDLTLRAVAPGWPYSLYAMIHARSREGLAASIGELDALAESVAGRPVPRVVLPTVREYKKAPPRYDA